MAARVIVSPLEPGESARELDFDARLTIGRASSNDLVIDQLDCSRNHAEVRIRSDGRYELIDLGSRNGCFVNGHRITGSRDLAHGDRIEIAEVIFRFFTPQSRPAASEDETKDPPTLESVGLHSDAANPPADASEPGPAGDESARDLLPAVVLASDIVGYRRMLEELAPTPFRRFASEWFEEAGRVIIAQRGALDRMTSGSVLGYWLVEHAERPQGEIALALRAAAELAALAEEFAACFVDRFGGGRFRIGVGVHVGSVELGNAGATQEQVWTLLGEAVTAAVALEGLAEERGHVVVVSDAVAKNVEASGALHPLGPAAVKQRARAIEAFALDLSAKASGADRPGG